MKMDAYGFIAWSGQEIARFELPWEGEAPAKDAIKLSGPTIEGDKSRYLKEARGVAPGEVLDLKVEDAF